MREFVQEPIKTRSTGMSAIGVPAFRSIIGQSAFRRFSGIRICQLRRVGNSGIDGHNLARIGSPSHLWAERRRIEIECPVKRCPRITG